MTVCVGWSVLEVGTGSVAASLIGMFLADSGARVLKVEPPGGDRLRSETPSGFLVWNRGKESVIADLRTAAGQVLVREAALHADVLVSGAPPSRLDQWGLGYEALHCDNPALVQLSLSGFGPTGAYAGIKGYEAVVAAKAGVVHAEHPIFGQIVRHGLPVGLSETPGRVAPSCLRGEHTRYVLAGLGYRDDEIDALVAKDAVFLAGPGETE